MKKLIMSFAAIIMMASMTTKVMAQNTAQNDARAEIEAIIAITAGDKLEFGRIAGTTVAGTVVLSDLGVTATNVQLLTGAVRAPATYLASGEPDDKYVISVPTADVIITNTSIAAGTKTMTVNAFVTSKASNLGTFDAKGMDNFIVGATLHVGTDQALGVYIGKFNVSIDYQ